LPKLPTDCEIIRMKVSLAGYGLRRCIELVRLIKTFKKIFAAKMERSFDLYVDSLDLLFLGLCCVRRYEIYYRLEIKDLHSLQLRKGFLSIVLRAVEKRMLQKVSMLVLTSQEYYNIYYKKIYKNRVEFVENWPDHSVWRGFTKKPREHTFVIGYIGCVRYMRCVYALVDAVIQLREKGLNVVVKFAGGGALKDLREYIGNRSGFEILGPFNYSKDIKDLYADVNLNFAVYDNRVKNVKYAMPNKYYETILAHIPILVAEGTFLERCVLHNQIGNIVIGDNANSIASRIEEAYTHAQWYNNSFDSFKKISIPDSTQLNAIATRAVIGK